MSTEELEAVCNRYELMIRVLVWGIVAVVATVAVLIVEVAK